MDSVIISQWGRLGISFYNHSNEEVDPERLLLATIPLLKNDRKLLSLSISWIFAYSDLLHVERLKQLAKKTLLIGDLPWLHAIGNKIAKSDARWKILGKQQTEKIMISSWDELQSLRLGLDSDFEDAGIRIAKFATDVEKKRLDRKKILEMNPLFSIRTLFGSNWRADILWLKNRFPDLSSYAIAKELGCNTETVYRISKQITQLDPGKVKNAISSIT